MRVWTAAAALTLAGLPLVLPSASAEETWVPADIQDFGFLPRELSAGVGQPVVWTNLGAHRHSVESKAPEIEFFSSGPLASGEAFSHTFASVGTFAYRCSIHASMDGVVQVGADPVTTTTVVRGAGEARPVDVAAAESPRGPVAPGGSAAHAEVGASASQASSPTPPPPQAASSAPNTVTTRPAPSTVAEATFARPLPVPPARPAPPAPVGPPRIEKATPRPNGEALSPPRDEQAPATKQIGLLLLAAGGGAFATLLVTRLSRRRY